jgi:hypothetical protein
MACVSCVVRVWACERVNVDYKEKQEGREASGDRWGRGAR